MAINFSISNKKTPIFDLSKQELLDFLKQNNCPGFRQKQIYQMLLQGKEFADMQTLPKELRQALEQNFSALGASIFKVFESKLDDTVKLLIRLEDSNIVESVIMKYHYGYTLCISTQVGCAMSCSFCASTKGGKIRNLSPAEMLAQVILANSFLSKKGKISNIVLMGIGEAFDNFNNTIKFLELVHNPDLLNIGYRSISISTCGLVPKIIEFSKLNIPITLCISLHAPNDDIRKKIMPIANTYSIAELMDAARYYFKQTGRRVVFEYALIDKVNSSPEDARALAKLLHGLQAHVNIIPLNKIDGALYAPPSKKDTDLFIKTLNDLNVSATKRRTMGADIDGACGQLRNRNIKA